MICLTYRPTDYFLARKIPYFSHYISEYEEIVITWKGEGKDVHCRLSLMYYLLHRIQDAGRTSLIYYITGCVLCKTVNSTPLERDFPPPAEALCSEAGGWRWAVARWAPWWYQSLCQCQAHPQAAANTATHTKECSQCKYCPSHHKGLCSQWTREDS